MKKTAVLIIVILLLSVLLITFLPIHGESRIYDSVVRLHVLANSDTEEDQALKLKVRDAILEVTSPAVANCSSQEEAINAIEEILPEIKETAQNTVNAEGYDYPVSVEIGREHYPTRNYDNFCFPSGTYISLRVNIGAAEGHNWWCVLFPPMCMSAATVKKEQTDEDLFISAGLTPDQYKIITESNSDTKYKVRFKLLELFEDLFGN